MIARIGRWCFTHRWTTIGLWVAAIFALSGVAQSLGPAYSDDMSIPESESASGFEVVEQNFGGAAGSFLSGQIVFVAEQGVDDPEVQAAMEAYFAAVAEIPEVTEVQSPYGPTGSFQISTQGDLTGKVAFANLSLDPDTEQQRAGEIGKQLQEDAPELEGLRIEIGGQNLAEFEPPSSELIGLAFAIIVLILAFGSVLAMGLPIGVALAGVSTGSVLVMLISHLTTVPEFSTTIGAMIGLGVGIDYALFIVTRYREGLHHGLDPLEATGVAMDTAGRAVIFAGLTVVISLLGMLVIGLSFVSGLGISASVTVLVTMAASTTLLPALLGLARHRVEVTRWRGLIAAGLVAVALLGAGLQLSGVAQFAALGAGVVIVLGLFFGPLKAEVPRREPKPMRETSAYRWSRLIQRRPWTAAISGTLVLLVMAAPVLSLRLGFSDEGNFPEESTTRQAYDLLADGFGPGFNGPFMIVTEVDSPEDLATLATLSQQISTTQGVALATPPIPNDAENPTAAMIRIIPTTSPQDEATEALVAELRETVVPDAVAGTDLAPYVTGFVPISIDFSSYLAERMLVFFGVVLTLSFLLLMAVFRSLLVPLKAVIMNMLSLAAAYGVAVAVFQWGWGGPVLGIGAAPIEPFIPMMMFAIVFGLSMDYEVFLLSRIKEEYDRSGDAKESVADGLAATARVITAAAAIMVVVFGSFLFEDQRVVKLFGTGLAVAVLLDATLIRMLLVPATMELLGEKNWWLPGWLDRILPRINVEGHYLDVGEDGEGFEDLPTEENRTSEPALR